MNDWRWAKDIRDSTEFPKAGLGCDISMSHTYIFHMPINNTPGLCCAMLSVLLLWAKKQGPDGN